MRSVPYARDPTAPRGGSAGGSGRRARPPRRRSQITGYISHVDVCGSHRNHAHRESSSPTSPAPQAAADALGNTGDPRAPRLPAAPFTNPLVHRLANRGEKFHWRGVPGRTSFRCHPPPPWAHPRPHSSLLLEPAAGQPGFGAVAPSTNGLDRPSQAWSSATMRIGARYGAEPNIR